MWNDNRKNYFSPIEQDPYSLQELDFMLKPLYKINPETGIIIELGEIFKNEKYGIIIQSENKKATYLPEVFKNTNWNNLLKSIKNKANINNEHFELFAYKIYQIKSKFIDILIDNIFARINILNFSNLLLNNLRKDLEFPLIYYKKEDKILWNNEQVRNISSVGYLYKYITRFSKIIPNNDIEFIKNKINEYLKNLNKYNAQSLSFLGYFYKKIPLNNKKEYCDKLLYRLPFAETDFEKPEILIGLNNAGCKLNYNDYPLTFNSDDSIFKMNWSIQTIINFGKQPDQKLIDILEKKIDELLISSNIETNYIAIAFEILCTINLSYKSMIRLFQLFFLLENRKNNNLYEFLNNTARIDITTHVNNGLFNFIK